MSESNNHGSAQPSDAVLILSNGERFNGKSYGAEGTVVSRVLVHSAITGYQELLTSETVQNKIVLFTTPHIGNTGTNDTDQNSEMVQASGLIVRDPARKISNFRAERDLETDLVNSNVVGISGIDTRAVTKRLANDPEMIVAIFSGESAQLGEEKQLKMITETLNTDEKGA